MSWWFLADVVIRVPVQVSPPYHVPKRLSTDSSGFLRRKGLENGRSKDVVSRHNGLPIVSPPWSLWQSLKHQRCSIVSGYRDQDHHRRSKVRPCE
jgi:hypothetical protein